MRIVDVVKNFTRNGLDFKAGHSYVMAEDVEGIFRSIHGDCLGMAHPFEAVYRPYKGEDLTGKRLLAFRTGGIGDIFFLSPVLRYLKKKYPGCFLRVASGCKQPLENLPEIDELYDMPFDAKLLDDSDCQLTFQGILEGSSEPSKRIHAVDMFYSYFSIDSTQFPSEDKRPTLVFSKQETEWMKKELSKLKIQDTELVVGIQLETSAPLRNFPREKMKTIIDLLAREPGVKTVLIGSGEQKDLANSYKGTYENVVTAMDYTVRQSIVLANRYNIILAPDSFMIQTAGALEKPLVGLYGPFSSTVRMKYFKNAIALEPSVPCSPCFIHDFRACIKGYPSPCFTLVTPEDVLQALDFLRNKFYKSHFQYMAFAIKEPEFTEIEKYFLSADKGLCFFPGYYKHHNMIRVDTNKFAEPDISDLSSEFKRDSFPFVVFMNDFSPKRLPVYHGAKTLVRPGGHFIVYKENATDSFFSELKKDIGKDFILMFSTFDPAKKYFLIIGRKAF